MKPSTSSEDQADLSALAARASREVQSREVPETPETQVGQPNLAVRRFLAGIAACVGVSAALVAAWPRLFDASDEALKQDLVQIVEAARRDVEAQRAATGALPQALSDPGLAAVVRYERRASGYRLVATVHTVSVVADESGTLR